MAATILWGDDQVPVLQRDWKRHAQRLPYRKTYRLKHGERWHDARIRLTAPPFPPQTPRQQLTRFEGFRDKPPNNPMKSKTPTINVSRFSLQLTPALVAAVAVAAFWAMPGTARGQIFETNGGNNTIGEYNATTGATVNASLVSAGLNGPAGIAVSGGNLFVANENTGTIGEYNATTGATVNSALISGLDQPQGIAVSGGNLFVANEGDGTIGEYNATTGTTVNSALISGLGFPFGIAVSGGNLFVVSGNTIGEYNATTGATVNSALISGLNNPWGIAVSGGDLFVTNTFGYTIGEYTTSGATVNSALISGLNYPTGIAVSGGNLFVVCNGTIGEYNATTGATVNASLVSGLNVPDYIAVVTPTPTPTPSHLGNISTRGLVQTGSNVMIGGFVISGTQPKKVIIHAGGPSLAQFGLAALSDPNLQLYDSSGAVIAKNDNWQTTEIFGIITSDQVSDIQNSGHTPSQAADSAIIVTLAPGAYTAIVSGVNGATGIGIVEVFDLDTGSRLVNISTRGLVQTGANVLIGGFVISGTQPEKVIIHAGGPSLAQFGLAALSDPNLQLYDSSGAVIAKNDNWQTTEIFGIITSDQVSDIQNSGHTPSQAADSAIIATLAPGAYTAIVSGVNGVTGIGIVEVFDLQ